MAMPQVTAQDVFDLYAIEPLDRHVLAEVPAPPTDHLAIELRTEARGAGHYILAYQVDVRERFDGVDQQQAQALADEINELRAQGLAHELAREAEQAGG